MVSFICIWWNVRWCLCSFYIIFYIFKNKYVNFIIKNNKSISIGGACWWFGENLSVFKMQRLLGEGDGENLERVACEGKGGKKPQGPLKKAWGRTCWGMRRLWNLKGQAKGKSFIAWLTHDLSLQISYVIFLHKDTLPEDQLYKIQKRQNLNLESVWPRVQLWEGREGTQGLQ